MSIKREDARALAECLRRTPTEESDQITKLEMVSLLAPAIREMQQEKGFTIARVAAVLSENGFHIAPGTLKNYLQTTNLKHGRISSEPTSREVVTSGTQQKSQTTRKILRYGQRVDASMEAPASTQAQAQEREQVSALTPPLPKQQTLHSTPQTSIAKAAPALANRQDSKQIATSTQWVILDDSDLADL